MSTSLAYAQAVRHVLSHALDHDESVMVLGESVGRMGGEAGSTADLQKTHPDRVRDLPIGDRGTIGVAVGMALAGKRPVVSLAGAERLVHVLGPLADAARVANDREFDVPLVVRVPYGDDAPGLAPTLGALCDVPGLTVACPADAGMAAGLLRWSLAQRGPVVLLEPRRAMERRSTVTDDAVSPSARVLRLGVDATVATWGPGVGAALEAADALAAEGVSIDIVDLVALSPLDHDTLGERLRTTGRLVVVAPGTSAMDRAWSDRIRTLGLDEAFLYLDAPIGHAIARPQVVVDAVRGAAHY